VGVLLPITGFVAGPGEDAAQGLQLFFDQFGDGTTVQAAGVDITFVLEDTGSDPAVALTSATKLVDVDDVDIIIPGILASTGGAVGDALGDRTDVMLLSPYSCNDDFTQRTPLDGYARPGGWACSQSSHAFGKWAYEEAGHRNIATACADYTFGYEHCGGFVDAFTSLGGTIANDEQIWFPPPTQDFGTYATQLSGLDVDAIMGLAVGGSAVPFVTAYSEFGLKDRIPMLGGAVTTDQSVLRAMDESTVLGTISHGHWAEGADIAETQEFVQAFDDATGKLASYYAAANYAAMQWIVATLEVTGGQFSPDLFFDTMTSGMEVSTPFGPQTLDSFGSPVLNIYIREVVKREDGRLWNVPIFTYEKVDQFFPFEQAEYLQQPAYTKDFQGNNAG
jgi:branched-chain amino acid transport system substrate-binding protein